MPIVDGKQAEAALRGAVILLGILIVAITAIVIGGNEIPPVFTTSATLLVGFIIGTRVVTNDVKEAINSPKTNGVKEEKP